MITTTYLALVAVLGFVLWRVRARHGSADRAPGRVSAGFEHVRAALSGAPPADDDLVERMAACLVEGTTAFGSSYAIPGHLGAELPAGVFAAASAAKPQLTGEVLDRYQDMMVERGRRLGRAEFVLPADYVLRLALSAGPEEVLLASFEPIVDVRAAVAPRPRRAPVPVHAPDDDGERTRRRRPSGDDGETTRRGAPPEPGATVVLLSVDDVPHGQHLLDSRTPVLTVGRGSDAVLRCPDDLAEVSRVHAEVRLAQGRVCVEDMRSANGTWLERAGGESSSLAPGAPAALEPGDVVWLDEQHRVTVTVL